MQHLYERSQRVIAQGALTNSKRPETFVKGVYPTHLKKGQGCHVWDYDGKKYVDFITGLGSSILGYAHESVNEAIKERLQLGASISLGTHEEVELAEKLKVLFPFIDCVKFLKTGSEACSAAVRIARTYTDKKWILSNGYHGWSDLFVSTTPPALGIQEKFNIINFNPTEESALTIPAEGPSSVAAIIVEPVVTELSEKRVEWLRKLRAFCDSYKALLIFDEVITGFRFPQFSVANYIGIEPDLIILGKAIANGMPLSVVAGKKEIMNCDEYFVSSTFAGETLSLVSAKKTIELLQTKYSLKDLWQKGEDWLAAFNSFWPEKIKIEGYPTRGRFEGDPEVKALFFQEACEAGILFGPSWFFNFPLSERKEVLGTLKDILCKIKLGSVKLKGERPQSPFAEKMRKANK